MGRARETSSFVVGFTPTSISRSAATSPREKLLHLIQPPSTPSTTPTPATPSTSLRRAAAQISRLNSALTSSPGIAKVLKPRAAPAPPRTPPPRRPPRSPSRGRPGLAKRCPVGHGRFRASARTAPAEDVEDPRVRAKSEVPRSMPRRCARVHDPAPMLRKARRRARPARRPAPTPGPAAGPRARLKQVKRAGSCHCVQARGHIPSLDDLRSCARQASGF